MSNACSRLFQIFKNWQSRFPRPPKPKPPRNSRRSFPIREIVNEPDPDKLARKCKQQATWSRSFRDRNNVYDLTIGRLAIAERFTLIEDILETHKGFEDMNREGFAVRLIHLYGKAGMFDHARQLFDELSQRNCPRSVESLNALMKAGLDSKKFDEVRRIFREVPKEMSMKLDLFSYNTVIHALCEMGSLDEAVLMLEEMKKSGLSPDVFTFNILLYAFYREKGLEGGERIWAMMVEHNVKPNARSHKLKLQALVNADDIQGAIDLFRALQNQGLKYKVDAFNALIKGFLDQGNMVEAKRWYNALLESGSKPNRMTFSILVPKFCDDGDFDMAFDLSKKMFNRHIVVDEALLQLVVNGLAEISLTDEAKELVELGKSNSYVQYNVPFSWFSICC